MPNYTPEQQAVIDFVAANPEKHLMVSARAGSGKTFTIEHAARGIKPTIQCLAVAFNKRIAQELQARLPSHVTCSTLNSVGHRAWGSAIGRRLTIDADKTYRLAKDALVRMADQLGPDPDNEFLGILLSLVRGAKSAGLVPNGAPMGKKGLIPDTQDSWDDIAWGKGQTTAEPELIAVARRVLLDGIKESYSGTIDFDDQIYMSALFGGRFQRYHTVMVDESQDLSPLNHLMLQKLVWKRLIAIGDPYQAIYGFRGADSESMTSLEKMFEPMTVLPLTYSFRCPAVVAKRQTGHVPDFKAHESCKEGDLSRWPSDLEFEDGKQCTTWDLDLIPTRGAIICRNNAPLMRLAFALIKARRPVKILGRDIGASLAALLTKIVGRHLNTSVGTASVMIDDWKKKELEKLGDKESRKETILDRAESLQVLLEASGSDNVGDCVDFIRDLFSENPDGLILTSGHRSKGLEWDWVMHLDPWRVPSRFAEKAAQNGNHALMEQELNLRYVIETRTKDELVLANLIDCEELQGGEDVQGPGGFR
jgi:DNA helicase-2/ATP-dependent DNA helicase PcrA